MSFLSLCFNAWHFVVFIKHALSSACWNHVSRLLVDHWLWSRVLGPRFHLSQSNI